MFEIGVKDEFLPIYTHPLYSKLFKENSSLVSITQDAYGTRNSKLNADPLNSGGNGSLMSSSMIFGSGGPGNKPLSPYRTDQSIHNGGRTSKL